MGTVLGMLTENTHFKIIHNAFPRIGDKLQTLWGNPEFGHYMNTLLRDTRDGARRAFRSTCFLLWMRWLKTITSATGTRFAPRSWSRGMTGDPDDPNQTDEG